jgi:hypothetical protein
MQNLCLQVYYKKSLVVEYIALTKYLASAPAQRGEEGWLWFLNSNRQDGSVQCLHIVANSELSVSCDLQNSIQKHIWYLVCAKNQLFVWS